ncbi:Protease HtpX [uncultured archaeon]|nr:Protease HtpX [uncultured archaeon]
MTAERLNHVDFRDQISKNKLKSFVLVFLIFIVFLIFGYVISMAFEPGLFLIIMILSVIVSIGYILLTYYKSDKIAIASSGAKPASREKYREFYNLVEGLTIASGLPMPQLFIIESNEINAFASGRNPGKAVVAVTTGALEKLDKRELEGVLAHELGHVGNYDIRFMTLVAVMVGMIAIISEIFLRSLWFSGGDSDNKGNVIFLIIGIVLAILAPIVVQIVQLSISRKREYSADATAVKFTRNPQGLIGALKKIKKDYEGIEGGKKIRVTKSMAPLYFANPFREIFSTHPDINKRISVLEAM